MLLWKYAGAPQAPSSTAPQPFKLEEECSGGKKATSALACIVPSRDEREKLHSEIRTSVGGCDYVAVGGAEVGGAATGEEGLLSSWMSERKMEEEETIFTEYIYKIEEMSRQGSAR